MKRKSLLLLGVIFGLLCGSGLAQEIPEGFRLYKVKQGDVLGKIAPREQWDLIKRVNRIDEYHLIIGKKILVPTDWAKAKRFLPIPQFIEASQTTAKAVHIFLDRQYFGAYEKGNLAFWGPISSGMADYRTSKGSFKTLWKRRLYYSEKYEAEMPYAICYSNSGYFLHAQALPGRPSSHGCVRLLDEDAKKLFEWIKKGDVVMVE
ncbi:MAG: L,D-transpeptidase [Candidatus Kerfeldbacteria bacterium CG08_land_8_20_14_0_20_40_16]|uniref:L,D-transpeptidase n=1 Tax=Candidatus Kerfeldbacteria bacterium CG08_land_8_20_14_0_20_40_16 TaxID=2014244 RepID=A0A2H0YUC0_9BACT|nr:MAG: L,D-transpeptidase [Candidatus Kerfeldbacteria bacterium CG08_land_8_20_14_0_20_40_16]